MANIFEVSRYFYRVTIIRGLEMWENYVWCAINSDMALSGFMLRTFSSLDEMSEKVLQEVR